MRDTPDSLMIFAAGFGTRMGALTRDRPKPLVEVAGRPLIDHALDVARGADVKTVVANLHYKPKMLATHLAPLGVKMSLEPDEILDTGGGLKQARALTGPGAVFTLNSDSIWTGANPLRELAQAWDRARMDALLLLLPPEAATGHQGKGDFVIIDGRLTRGPGHVYSGAQIIKTELLDQIPDKVFSLNVLWNRLIPEGRLFGTVHDGGWCDVGHPGGIQDAEALLANV